MAQDIVPKTLTALIRGYIRDVRPDLPSSQRQKMESAVNSWRWHLGREPTTADLEYERATEWIESLRGIGRQRTTMNERLRGINILWTYAHDRGLVGTLPAITAASIWNVNRPGRNSVEHIFRTKFAAEYLQTHAVGTVAQHLTAIRRLSAYLGHHLTLAEFTPELIAAFLSHAVGAGVSPLKASRYVGWLTFVGRRVKPEAFPDKDRFERKRRYESFQTGTLRHYFETVYRPLKMRNKVAATHRKYEIVLRHFDRYLGGPATLDDLNDATVTDFVFSLPQAPHTVNGYRKSLLCLWRYAWRKGVVKTGPDVEAVKEFSKPPRALTEAEFARLVDVAQRFNIPGVEIAGIPSPDWWTSLILAAYDTGLRIGALLTATFADLDVSDPERPSMLIHGEAQKTGKWARRPLHPQTWAAIQRTMTGKRRTQVWPWGFDRTYFWNVASALFESAGLPKRVRFHALRKTAATLVAKHRGVEKAREYLQHANLRTTLESYIDTSRLDDERPCDLLPRPTLKGGVA